MAQNLEEAMTKMIKEEESTISHLSETILKIHNTVAKLLLQTLMTDSLKHANILRMILGILKNPNISKEDMKDLIDSMKRHNEEEAQMMRNFEDMLEKTEDRRIRFLLENVVTDEKRHHSITERMVELIGNSQTSDDEWWDFLYRYSRLTQ